MFDLKTIIVTIVVAVVTSMVTVGLVGNNQLATGGETRFPNSNLTAQNITATGNFDASGEAHQFGSASIRNVFYIGAVDGCAAVFYNSSTTQTVQATSTSFCNS